MTRIGLISDTHGLLRPEAVAFMRGCDAIIHGGDIGEGILEQLATIAPVTAVRGNNDNGVWAQRLCETEMIKSGALYLYAIHDLAQLDIDPVTAGVRVVVSGHSHKPKLETRAGVLYVNPGSAGPRRFSLPLAAGELMIKGHSLTARIIDLQNAWCPTLIST